MSILTGRRIDTGIGFGVRRMDGRGSVTNRGVGRHITTAVGCFTAVTGRGVHAAHTIEVTAGGVRRWLPL